MSCWCKPGAVKEESALITERRSVRVCLSQQHPKLQDLIKWYRWIILHLKENFYNERKNWCLRRIKLLSSFTEQAYLLCCKLSQLWTVNRSQPAASCAVRHRNGWGVGGKRGWGSAVLKQDTFGLRSNPHVSLETPPDISSTCCYSRPWRKRTHDPKLSVDEGILGQKQNASVRNTAFLWVVGYIWEF